MWWPAHGRPSRLNNAGRDLVYPYGKRGQGAAYSRGSHARRPTRSWTKIRTLLEEHYKNMQDVEFTIQDGRLWMLQTRHGKRTGKVAAIRIAAEMQAEGLVTKEEALLLVDAGSPGPVASRPDRSRRPGRRIL